MHLRVLYFFSYAVEGKLDEFDHFSQKFSSLAGGDSEVETLFKSPRNGEWDIDKIVARQI